MYCMEFCGLPKFMASSGAANRSISTQGHEI